MGSRRLKSTDDGPKYMTHADPILLVQWNNISALEFLCNELVNFV